MDLQTDNKLLQDAPKLREGERVEVRQKDVGLRGSWHPGTIVGLAAGRRLVEYDELLTEDGLHKLRESIPCPRLSDIAGTIKAHTLMVASTRSPSKRRGFLRPCPPPSREMSPLTWKAGIFVDVFYQDAWWEAVLLKDVTSLDDSALVDVHFPDEGDLARVHVKDMRISQCWDDVSGGWSLKGSIDLSRFWKRRGIRKNEVSLTADSNCRTNEICNNSMGNETKLDRNNWPQVCPSSGATTKREHIVTPVIPQALCHGSTVFPKPHEELPPSNHHKKLISSCLNVDENTIRPLTSSRDDSSIADMPEAECHLEVENSFGRSKKVSCEGLQHPEIQHCSSSCGKNTEMVDTGQEVWNKQGVAECVQLPSCEDSQATCFEKTKVEKECSEGNVFFKRRKTVKIISTHVRKPDSKSMIPYVVVDSTAEGLKNSSVGTGECNTPCKITVEGNRPAAVKCPGECGSVMMLRETKTRFSLGLVGQDASKKQLASISHKGKGFYRNNLGYNLLQTRPVCKTFLLALEAPVHKTQDEYKKIMSAGTAALGVATSCRKRRKKRSARNLQAKVKTIILAGDKEAEGYPVETVMCTKPYTEKVTTVCAQNFKVDHEKINTAENPSEGWSALDKPSLSELKILCSPAQESSKDEQTVQAEEGPVRHTSNDRSVRTRKQIGELLGSAGAIEWSLGNDTLRSFKDHLVRQKKAMGLKRKASDIYSAFDACGKDVTVTEVPESEVDLKEPSDLAPILSLANCGDGIAATRREHKRIRVSIAPNAAEQSSALCSASHKGSNVVKKKASNLSYVQELGGRNIPKLLGVSKAQKRRDQFATFKGSNVSKSRAYRANSIAESGDRSVVRSSRLLKAEGKQDQPEAASTSNKSKPNIENHKNIDDKSLKNLAREIGLKAIFEAGFTMEYRIRRSESASDAVYTSPTGSSYWSLPKAWEAVGNDKKGRIKVEKAVIQQVFSKIEQDEKCLQAFQALDKFSGTSIEDVMKHAIMTYAELTDFLLMDLRVLRKTFSSFKRIENNSKTSLPGTSLVKKRGRKPKQKAQSVFGETKLSTSKCYSMLKHVQSSSLSRFGKNRSKPMDRTSRILKKSYNRDFRKATFKADSTLLGLSIQKLQKNLKSSSRKYRNKEANSKMKLSKQKVKELKPRSGLRLEIRPSSSCVEDLTEELSCQNRRTVLLWMIDRGVVSETERVSCVDQLNDKVVKEGVLTREGIVCICCERVYALNSFAEHSGIHGQSSNCKLVFASGKTLVECQSKAWKKELHLRRTQNYNGVSANDTNDDTCLLCGDGGVLLCCDFCPSTFHAFCLQLDDVPEGNWYCPNCCCGVCRLSYCIEEQALCSQCEHKYHIACVQGGQTVHRGKFLCSDSCKKIYFGLKNLIGITHSLGKGFSWTLLHCIEEPQPEEVKVVMGNNSKLAVALLVLKECFNPMEDPRTNTDMITHAVYNRRSQFWRLNYVGFYTVVLERDDEIISVASIRIHGAKIAEMPLIGTRHKHRRQGMCRLLVGAIEKLLSSLEVATFILPAIPELYETWTQAFGFRPLDSSLRLETKDLSMMIFPGTDLLQKSLPGGKAVSPHISLPY